MQKRIKEILIDISQKTYGEKPSYFNLKIIPEERKTFHGDYCPNTKEIRIFNLSRPVEHIISTTIHELAHHIDFQKYGSSGHNKRFYGIFRELLKTAIECGYVDYSSVKNKKDSRDIVQMEKYYGELVAYYDKEKDNNIDKCVIKIKNAFNIKEFLLSEGFSFNSLEKTWDLNTKKDNTELIKKTILEKDKSVEIIINDYNDIQMETYYYIVVSKGSYEKRDILSKNKYLYKGFNEKTNSWVKKIKTNELKLEKKFLNELGLDYKIRH